MPLYDFKCTECGQVQEHIAHIEERIGECVDCQGLTKRMISANYNVIGDVDFVTDNITGDPIRVSSRKQLRGLMERYDVAEKYGKQWY
jgi:putative FmdB family regulatory protein